MSCILPAQWALAERLYFEGETSVADIAKRCGMVAATLRRRAKARGWPPHNTLELDGSASERARLRRVIARKLTRLEARMEKPDTDNAADSDRQTREYGSLLTTVEKLDAKESGWKRTTMATPTQDPSNTNNHGDNHVEQWRAELARRIARLDRGGTAQ